MISGGGQNIHLWQGEWIDDDELDRRLPTLGSLRGELLAKTFPLDALLNAADRVAGRLIARDELYEQLFALVREAGRTTEQDIHALLGTIGRFITRGALKEKLTRELGSDRPAEIRRVAFAASRFEAWAPLGLVVHVAPANVFTVGSLGVIEALLAGNMNFLKTSGTDSLFPQVFLEALCRADADERIAPYVIVGRISSARRDRIRELFDQADAISAWGGEESIRRIREEAPPQTRVITWGHKLSFAYVAAGALQDDELLRQLAADCCLIEQQACSSPQTVFVETDSRDELFAFAERLAALIASVSPGIPRIDPDSQEQAEITSVIAVARIEEALGETRVFEAADGAWRVMADVKPGLQPSPLYRSVWVKPLLRERIVETLRPLRCYLQSAGVACAVGDLVPLTRHFLQAGVTRITKVGRMLESYSGAPHDGIYALQQFAQRISLQWDNNLEGFSRFTELEPELRGTHKGPILTKHELQSRPAEVADADLFFRSGGSTGRPVMSIFSYDEYHEEMAAAAYGLYAAGLDPLRDRTINLFAAGNLYGGFLSFFTILEHLGAPQLPMALVENTETVAQIIVNFGATALLGPPSYILRLFREQEDLLKKYRGMTKVFYGGDHMTRAQVDFLKNEFGIPVVRSAIYGSNDAGPLGYQCPYCAGGEHHLLSSIQDLEIVHLEEDRPVERGASGRLIFSPKRRYGQRIERYEIGDIGRWIDTSCPCGRKEPRFVLEGRTGDVFKAGGPFFNYRNFVNILTDRFDYAGNVQILLANRGIQTLLLLRLEKDFLERHPGARQTLIYDYAELKFCLEQGLNLLFEVEGISEDEFSRVPQTGKIKHIIDQRME